MEPLKQPKFVAPNPEDPTAILTLADCSLDLNRMRAGDTEIIVMRFAQKGLGFLIDVPWEEADFRMMLAAWQARLGSGGNGQGTSPN